MATYRSPFTHLRQQLYRQQEFLRDVLKDVTDLTQENLAKNTPGKTLPDEWKKTVEVSGRKGTGEVKHTRLEADRDTWEPIFGYLNFGTRSHYVEPVNAQALHWKNTLGEDCFSKGHVVGPILAAHFAEHANDKIEDFSKTLQKRWEDFVNAE